MNQREKAIGTFAWYVVCAVAAGLIIIHSAMAQQHEPKHEAYYATKIAEKNDWEQEVVLWDGTRVDLVSETRAWEVDWPVKWAEAIGQALYYAEVTVKEPGIILLVRDMDRERRYVYRCAVVCAKYDIRLLVIKTGVLE